MLAARFMSRRTGEPRWTDLFLQHFEALWEPVEICRGRALSSLDARSLRRIREAHVGAPRTGRERVCHVSRGNGRSPRPGEKNCSAERMRRYARLRCSRTMVSTVRTTSDRLQGRTPCLCSFNSATVRRAGGGLFLGTRYRRFWNHPS